MSKKIGSLSRKSFFPTPGDVFRNLDDKTTYVAVQIRNFRSEVTGTKVRYALLEGVNPEFEGQATYETVHSEGSLTDFLGSKESLAKGAGIQQIQRTKRAKDENGEMVETVKVYDYNPKTDTWQEQGDVPEEATAPAPVSADAEASA